MWLVCMNGRRGDVHARGGTLGWMRASCPCCSPAAVEPPVVAEVVRHVACLWRICAGAGVSQTTDFAARNAHMALAGDAHRSLSKRTEDAAVAAEHVLEESPAACRETDGGRIQALGVT